MDQNAFGIFAKKPNTEYVKSSLIEFVRRRVHSDKHVFVNHQNSPRSHQLQPMTTRRCSSVPTKPIRKSFLKQESSGYQSKENSNNKEKKTYKHCPKCRIQLRARPLSYAGTHGQNIEYSPPSVRSNHRDIHYVVPLQKSSKSLRGEDRTNSFPFIISDDNCHLLSVRKNDCQCSHTGGKRSKSLDVVTEYSFSIGFKVKRKEKSNQKQNKAYQDSSGETNRKGNEYWSEEHTNSCGCQRKACSCCTCSQNVNQGYCQSLGNILSTKETQNSHGTSNFKQSTAPDNVRLRGRSVAANRNLYQRTTKRPRPLSDSFLSSSARRSLFKVYEFDPEFIPVEHTPVAQNTMKTSSSKKPVRVHLLNNEHVLLVFDSKASVQQLFDQVCSLLSIKEGQFFGLSTLVENEKWFMDMKQKIAKYAPKDWGKEIRRRASDVNVASSSVLNVQFQVQFYVEHPKLISDKASRHQYYLQMKKNVARSIVLTQDEVLFTLASIALQADVGDHNLSEHKEQYFKPEDYFPDWFVQKWGREYLLSHLPTLHDEHKGMANYEAQAKYIQQASGIDDVPVNYYKLYKHKKESKASVMLGIYNQGIRIHYGNPDKTQTPWKLEFEFMWNKVGRLFFTGKRFEIYPEDLPASRRLTYYTGSHSRSKYLLHFLRETHSLYMSLSPYAQHMKRVEGRRAKRRFRESYISGKNLDLERNVDGENHDFHLTDNEEEIRKTTQDKEKLFNSYYDSTTSHGSSHTSGIESDSKQRTEGEEEEEDEIFHNDEEYRKEVIDVTEDHLVGPAPKSLSVTNLATSSNEMKFTFAKDMISDALNSNKPSRGGTLTGEEFSMAALSIACENNNLKMRSEPDQDSREGTLKNGVPVEMLVTAADMKQQTSNQGIMKKSSRTEKKKESSHALNGKVKMRTKHHTDMSTQTATPLQVKKPSATHSDDKTNLYYDDFHTIPRKHRHSRSRTEEPKSTNGVLSVVRTGSDVQEEHHGRRKSRKSQQKNEKNTRRYSSAQSEKPTHQRHCKDGERGVHRTHSSDSFNQRQIQTNREMETNNHGNSVSCIPTAFVQHEVGNEQQKSAFVTISRPIQRNRSNENARAYYTVARSDSHDKHMYFRTKTDQNDQDLSIVTVVGSTQNKMSGKRDKEHSKEKKTREIRHKQKRHSDVKDKERLSSYEDDTFSQKMSEACVRTLSAQQRKLSDSRFNQRMDSGRSSLRTTDDSSNGLYPAYSPTDDATYASVTSSPHTPTSKQPLHYDLLRTPFIQNYKEVIV